MRRTNRLLVSSLSIALTSAGLWARPARAESPTPSVAARECRRIARQMIHFAQVQEMARERGNALWAASTGKHLAQLEARWDAGCDRTDEAWAAVFARALKAAGSAALRYFTFGGWS